MNHFNFPGSARVSRRSLSETSPPEQAGETTELPGSSFRLLDRVFTREPASKKRKA
jgi:hypothetical protein